MCRLPGQISTRPASRTSPDCASLTRDGADFIQTPGKHFGETFRHVLHHHDGAGKIRRQLREYILQSLRSSGGNADGDHFGRSFLGVERSFLSRTRGHAHRPDGHAPALGRGLDLADQFRRDLRHAGGDVIRLGHKIKRAQRQGLQRDRSSLRAVGTHHDDRQAVAAHDFLEHVDAAHARHFQIEGHDLGLQLFDFSEAEISVHGGAHHLDRTVGLQNLWNQLPHERGIVHHQYAHRAS